MLRNSKPFLGGMLLICRPNALSPYERHCSVCETISGSGVLTSNPEVSRLGMLEIIVGVKRRVFRIVFAMRDSKHLRAIQGPDVRSVHRA